MSDDSWVEEVKRKCKSDGYFYNQEPCGHCGGRMPNGNHFCSLECYNASGHEKDKEVKTNGRDKGSA